MSKKEPLLASEAKKPQGRSKASVFYDANEYMEQLKKRYEVDEEIETLMMCAPDSDWQSTKGKDKMLTVEVNEANRSKITGRLFPEPNKPDPMPADLAFFFTKINDDETKYLWRFCVAMFILEWVWIVLYALGLFLSGGELFWPLTIVFGVFTWYTSVQQIYVDHDIMHGATFPPEGWPAWLKYFTHPFSDFISLPWEEFVLEHQRHHASTIDLLTQGEFGWDPEMPLYWLQDKRLNPWRMFTFWLVPVIHFFGLNDTGGAFALEWYMHFPDPGPGGKCNKEFWSKWLPRRLKHQGFVLAQWCVIFCIGMLASGNGLKFVLTVSLCCRLGYGSAWFFVTNFTHSVEWNHFLAHQDHNRNFKLLHKIMALLLGGKHRWNEMLFHDVHHAFPNAVGTLSQRGRFHGYEAVMHAATKVLDNGLFKANGDEQTTMQKNDRKRSMKLSSLAQSLSKPK
jgi:hypothetical protein